MRHPSFSRSKSKRWQRLTAFLTAIALIAGLLPLQAVTVMADTTTKEFEFVFSNTPNMEGLSVEYKFDDQTEWSEVANYIEVNSKDYKFSLTNEESKGLSLRINLGKNYIMSGTVGNSPDDANPVALGESNTTQVENQNAFIYHYDDFTTGGRCFKLELFEQNATYPYLFEVRKDGHGEISFDQSLPNMEIDEWIVILSNQKTLDVTVTPDKNDEADPNDDDRLEVLRLAQFNADPIELSEEQGFASTANGVAYNSETKKFTFTIQGEATEFRGIEFIFSGAFNPYEFRFFIDDNSNLTGAAVEYSVEYKLSTDTEWKDADFAIRLPGNFPYGDKVNDLQNGKVVIDNNQGELKGLSFELPGDKWYENPENPGEWLYPTVDFRITIPAESAAILDSAFFGYMGQNGPDEGSVFIKESGSAPSTTYCTTDASGNLTITFSNQDIFVNDCALPREFHLTFDSGFDPSDMYGAEFEIPCDNGWSISNEGQTAVFGCFAGNTISVTSTSNVVVEQIDQPNGPTTFIVWSDTDTFSVEAVTDPGYTAYHETNNERTPMTAETVINVKVGGKGYANTEYTRINFVMACINFGDYVSIDPNPKMRDDSISNNDYTLSAQPYTITYAGGTVKVELVDEDPDDNVTPTWSGYKDTWHDNVDDADRENFKIETTAQVKLTVVAFDGYKIRQDLELGGEDPNTPGLKLDLDENGSCIVTLQTEKTGFSDPFEQILPPSYIFEGAADYDADDIDNGVIVVFYQKDNVTIGEVTVTRSGEGSVFYIDDSEGKIEIVSDYTLSLDLSSDPSYTAELKVNEIDGIYTLEDMAPGTKITVDFKEPKFSLEMWGDYSIDGNASSGSFTLTYENGSVEVTDYNNKFIGMEGNNFQFGGNSIKFTIKPNNGYKLSKLKVDNKDVDIVEGDLLSKDINGNWVLTFNDLGKDNNVKVEVTFDPLPELKFTNYIEYESGTLEFEHGTVTVGNTQTNVFSDYAPIDSDITFNITPADGFICYAYLNGNQPEYVSGTYTLKASELNGKNELYFKFEPRNNNSITIVEFTGTAEKDDSETNYKITYDHGSVLIPVASIDGEPVETDGITRFKVNSNVSNLAITLEPSAGYNAKLLCSGQNCELTNNTYTLLIDPNKEGPYNFEATFAQINLHQATVTYNYEGEAAVIEIGENMLPYGQLTNKKVDFNVPLTPGEDGKVEIKLSVNFIIYMSELKIYCDGVLYDCTDQLPDNYKELYESFANQYTNITVKVPVANSYTIYTKAYSAERGNLDQLAVGNFLWFYDYNISIANSGSGDDYVENATLKVLQVQIKDQTTGEWGEAITTPIEGTAIDWEPITAVVNGKEEVVGGAAVLPAGSKVTMQLIPDYGTQLVKLGLNGEGFEVDQDEMYTYSFIVGPGNFHLNASFVPIADVVEDSTDTIDGGSIALGDGTVDNGTAVLYVGDANVAGAEKTNFENLAADEALEISSYLDISLDKVVYQGVSADEVKYDGDGKNVWTSGLNDLAKPATVTLTLTDDIGDGTVKVLHNHNGNLEVIDADYNPATKELTFETSSFSNYAIAVEAEQYKVTFNANGHGTAPAAQTVTSGSKATKPTDPTASGYTFGGWYADSACTKAYSFDTAVTANITLYAKWTAVTTPAPSTPSPTPSPTPEPTPTPTPEPEIVPSAELIPSGTAHVQDVGDVPVSVDPETGIMTLGTTGQGKRLEEITIDFENTTGLSGTMEYRVHVQDIGWMDWTEAGNPAGTEGISKRIEAIEIRLTGELADYYSVEYCVHIQDYGDMQGWVADGALAGTTGESKRIEQIKVRIVPKGSGDSMSVKYRVHIQDIGWEGSYASGGAMSGTSGQSKRLEAIEIFLTGGQYSGGIKYKTHVQDIGWESSYAQNGEMSGTQGQAKRLEGISIELYGEVAEYYDIYYRVHAQDIGWMGWAKNGEYAGTAGRSARLEGIQIVLVPKGGAAPGATYNGITAATDKAFIDGF